MHEFAYFLFVLLIVTHYFKITSTTFINKHTKFPSYLSVPLYKHLNPDGYPCITLEYTHIFFYNK